jgi:hypothetical protein
MKRIAIAGNLSRDFLHTNDIVLTSQGGPAYFIAKAAANLGSFVKVHTNFDGLPDWVTKNIDYSGIKNTYAVEVHIYQEDADVWISSIGEDIDFAELEVTLSYYDALVVSTIFEEFRMSNFEMIKNTYSMPIIVDIQGFLRRLTDENAVVKTKISLDFLHFVDVIKMNDLEYGILFKDTDYESGIRYLYETFNVEVILTRGSKGVIICNENGIESILPSENIVTRSTVGAGDTFLGAFAHYYIQGGTFRDSVIKAERETILFLKEIQRSLMV